MKRAFIALTVLAIFLFTGSLLTTTLADEDKDKKGTEVAFDELKSTAPAAWVVVKPTNRFRHAQFKLPAAKGDKEDAQVIVYKGFGGTAKQNLERWKAQFRPADGKAFGKDEIKENLELKIANRGVARLDVKGIFLDRPFPGSDKVTRRPEYQMVAVQFDAPKNVYHVKFWGPQKTVAKYLADFDKWLTSFK